MGMQKVEFSFPDEEDDNIEVEGGVMKTLGEEAEADSSKEDADQVAVEGEDEADDASDDDIEIVDDTPPEDRGREPSEPPEDVTEEELERYSEKVRKRIQHFAKGYHDERRAKETAARERAELERLAKQLYEENQKLKGTVGKSQTALLDQAKKVVQNELTAAKGKYREAYEAGDADKILEAEDALASARAKAEKLNNLRPQTLQTPKDDIQVDSDRSEPPPRQAPAPSVDPKAEAWAKQNEWFGSDEEMTSFALGTHQKLVKNGVDPTSDEYYEKLNSRMRQVFPENFGEAESKPEGGKPQNRNPVVAPATRSRAPKKVTLTKSQVAIAKRLGVPLKAYAEQLAEEMRKSKNG